MARRGGGRGASHAEVIENCSAGRGRGSDPTRATKCSGESIKGMGRRNEGEEETNGAIQPVSIDLTNRTRVTGA